MWKRNGRLAGGITVLAGLMAAASLMASCSNDSTGANETTEFGAPVTLGNGTAKSYIVQRNGVPTELGVILSEAALDNLQTAPVMGGYESLVPLPANNPTQYKVIGLNWNPAGHPPVYMLPHFDVHFYMISEAEKNAIVPTDPDFAAKAASLPAAAFSIPGFVNDIPANAVPRMGLHWTDPSAPEFHGVPFTRTFIEGSWNGRFIFLEPMLTRAYLLTHPNELVPVGRAPQTDTPGYYPGAYRASWDAGKSEWRIGLANLQ
jgi:hypothetical protein